MAPRSGSKHCVLHTGVLSLSVALRLPAPPSQSFPAASRNLSLLTFTPWPLPDFGEPAAPPHGAGRHVAHSSCPVRFRVKLKAPFRSVRAWRSAKPKWSSRRADAGTAASCVCARIPGTTQASKEAAGCQRGRPRYAPGLCGLRSSAEPRVFGSCVLPKDGLGHTFRPRWPLLIRVLLYCSVSSSVTLVSCCL